MLLEVQESSSMKKLQGVLQSRYGVDVMLKSISDVNDLFHDEWINDENELVVPISHQNKYLATALVSNAWKLNSSDQAIVTSLVQMYLENTLYNWYLCRQEQAQYSKNGFSADVHVDDDTQFSIPLVEPIADKKSLKIFSFEQAVNPEPSSVSSLNRLALKIHEKSERWAFMSFKDIAAQLKTTKDLSEMGAITLFVEDVTTLDLASQKLIVDYVQQVKSENAVSSISGDISCEGIQFILGFNTGLNALSQKLETNFYNLLKDNYIDMARLPIDKEKLDATLQLLV